MNRLLLALALTVTAQSSYAWGQFEQGIATGLAGAWVYNKLTEPRVLVQPQYVLPAPNPYPSLQPNYRPMPVVCRTVPVLDTYGRIIAYHQVCDWKYFLVERSRNIFSRWWDPRGSKIKNCCFFATVLTKIEVAESPWPDKNTLYIKFLRGSFFKSCRTLSGNAVYIINTLVYTGANYVDSERISTSNPTKTIKV